ncbi:hypothetical protein JX580_11160 [Thiomicrospira microaerophila]|nr:hypothetical protein JX580_11160 [Thiomicrospira microaerophila]
MAIPGLTQANQQQDRLLLQTSLWTKHFNPDPIHNNHQRLINLQWHPQGYAPRRLTEHYPQMDELDWFFGAARFKNSFSQTTHYAYIGGRLNFLQHQMLQPYATITGGLIHGYRGEYQDKIPLNKFGVAPAFIPSIGVEYRKITTEFSFFGASGVMLKMGYFFK